VSAFGSSPLQSQQGFDLRVQASHRRSRVASIAQNMVWRAPEGLTGGKTWQSLWLSLKRALARAVKSTNARGANPMNLLQAIASCFKKYATFSGRASRSEYWYWVLFLFLGRVVTLLLDAVIFHAPVNAPPGSQLFNGIFSLVILLPTFAVAVRRLHDVDRSGWWLLTYLTIIGIIYPLLVWKCTKGTHGPNRFGPDPLSMDWVVSQFD
jgi:uncharacterized membrane protein YhaH (DUF805 family)